MYSSQVSGSIRGLELSLVANCNTKMPTRTTIRIMGNLVEEISIVNHNQVQT
ncbi:MAG: hypothetical protein ACPG6Z_06695 [Nitrosopumilus sp.]